MNSGFMECERWVPPATPPRGEKVAFIEGGARSVKSHARATANEKPSRSSLLAGSFLHGAAFAGEATALARISFPATLCSLVVVTDTSPSGNEGDKKWAGRALTDSYTCLLYTSDAADE